jgi:hypothetical protein
MTMTTSGDDARRLDGNAAAGFLADLLPVDVTNAAATCNGCGLTSAIGALALYALEMGAVFRCPGCGDLMICVTRAHDVYCVDLRGVRLLRVAVLPCDHA